MSTNFFLRGLIIGFTVAAVVGPISVLIIRRTLAVGRLNGLFSGFGAASADAVYASVAGFGLTFISTFLVSQRNILSIVGGFFLFYLGIRAILAKVEETDLGHTKSGNLLAAYGSTFFLTLTNPMTILSYTAIFAGLGLGDTHGNYASAIGMILGVFSGTSLWFLLLTSAVSLLHSRFNLKGLQWVNRISGLVLFGFGAAALISAAIA